MSTYVGSKIEGKDTNGIIKDEDGYYKISFGKVNALNTSGVMFLIEDIDHMFQSGDTIISRRIKNGLLTGESNHPDFTGLSGDALVNKILNIDKNNECCLIKGVTYVKTGDYEVGFEDYPTYEIYGWVKPYGPNGDYLREALEEKHANVAFSIRSIAIPSVVGRIEVRRIIDIGTWDWVFEPGYADATQWNIAGVASVERYDLNVNLCVNGECATKLKEGVITGAFNNNNDINLIINALEKHKKQTHNPILDLV